MIDFYFDFISPYAYLAWSNPRIGPRALAAKHGVPLVVHPILFAGLLEKWGQLGPAEIPPKRAFLVKDVMRHAAREGIPLVYPEIHPFNPLPLLRHAIVEPSLIDMLFAHVWAGGPAIPDDPRTRDPDIKAALRRETDAALERGVFGVPTIIANGELFWGSDRAGDADRYLAGDDPVDRALAAAIIARPVGLSRK